MSFEKVVLNVVESVTEVPAYFAYGTLFLETVNSRVATEVFNALCDKLTCGVMFGKCGEFETSYDFTI
jgi:hypothetical protein